MSALYALSVLKGERVQQYLLKLLSQDSKSIQFREYAALILGNIGDFEIINKLEKIEDLVKKGNFNYVVIDSFGIYF